MRREAVAVRFASETGAAAEAANNVLRALRRSFRGISPTVSPALSIGVLDDSLHDVADANALRVDLLQSASIAIFVVSTTGLGDPPANMRRFWRALLHRNLGPNTFGKEHDREALRFAVVGLGDSSYRQFNFPAKKLYRRLLQLGAIPLLPRVDCDDQHYLGVDGTLIPFIEQLIPSVFNALHIDFIPTSTTSTPTPSATPILMKDVLFAYDQLKDNKPDQNVKNTIQSLFVREVSDATSITASILKKHGQQHQHRNMFWGHAYVTTNERLTAEPHFQDVRRIILSQKLLDGNQPGNNIQNHFFDQCFGNPLDDLNDFVLGGILQIRPENSKTNTVNRCLSYFGLSDVANEPLIMFPEQLIPEELRDIPQGESNRLEIWYKNLCSFIAKTLEIHITKCSKSKDDPKSMDKCYLCQSAELTLLNEKKQLLLQYPASMSVPPEMTPMFVSLFNPSGFLSLSSILREHLDFLGKPRRYTFDSLMEVLTHFNNGAEEVQSHFIEKLSRFATTAGQAELYDYALRPKRNVFDVLVDFDRLPRNDDGSCLAMMLFITDIIPQIKPRDYSISSVIENNSSVTGTEKSSCEVTISIDSFETQLRSFAEGPTSVAHDAAGIATGSKHLSRLGVCSNYVSTLKLGDRVRCKVKPGSLKFTNIDIPQDDLCLSTLAKSRYRCLTVPKQIDIDKLDVEVIRSLLTPIILVATGSGVAPLKPIIERRRNVFSQLIKRSSIPIGNYLHTLVILGNRFLELDFLFESFFLRGNNYKDVLIANNSSSNSTISKDIRLVTDMGTLSVSDGVVYIPVFSRITESTQKFLDTVNSKEVQERLATGYVQEVIKTRAWWDIAEYFLFGNAFNDNNGSNLSAALGQNKDGSMQLITINSGAFQTNFENKRNDRIVLLQRRLNRILFTLESSDKPIGEEISWKEFIERASQLETQSDDELKEYILLTPTLMLIGGRKSSGMPIHVKSGMELAIRHWMQWSLAVSIGECVESMYLSDKLNNSEDAITKIEKSLRNTLIPFFMALINCGPMLRKQSPTAIIVNKELSEKVLPEIISVLKKVIAACISYKKDGSLVGQTTSQVAMSNIVTNEVGKPFELIASRCINLFVEGDIIQEECWG